jgi:hypothetical protein
MPSAVKPRHRCAVALCAIAVLLCAVPAAAITEGDQPPPIYLDPNTPGSPARLAISVQPPSNSGDSPVRSLILSGPRGLKVDPRSRSARCSATQARNFTCPDASRVGRGQALGHATGAIFPGGRAEFFATVDAFLAPRVKKGDVAGVVLVVTESKSGAQASATGRIVPAVKGSGAFGVRLRFDDLPQYPGVTLSVDRIDLVAGAWRKVKRHRYSLLTNPGACGSAGAWPFRISVVYADHRDDSDLSAACRPR